MGVARCRASFWLVAISVGLTGCDCGARSHPRSGDAGSDAPFCVPAPESCNGEDDDCDGEVDEDVCGRACVGVGCGGWGTPPEGLRLGEDGALAVALPADDPVAVLWVPEHHARTLAKVDTRRREIVARYRTTPGCPDEEESYAYGVVADPDGNAYVLTGGPEADFTQVLSVAYDDCPDGDGDGAVETSRGPDDVLPFLDDECVRFRVEAPDHATMAFDRVRGLLWLGDRSGPRVYALDPETGEETGDEIAIDTAGLFEDTTTPGPLAFDSTGRLYAAPLSQWIVVIDPETGDVELAEVAFRGISSTSAQDDRGRLWFGMLLQTYDPGTDEWTYPNAYPAGRGRAVGQFVVASTGVFHGATAGERRPHRVTYDPEQDEFDVDRETDLAGFQIALDRDGYVWEIEGMWDVPCDARVCCERADDRTSAWVRSPWTDEREMAIDGALHHGAAYGRPTGVEPLDVLTPPRDVTATLEAGCDDARWVRLEWDARVPDGTAMTFHVQPSDSREASEALPWTFVGAASSARMPVLLGEVAPAPARYLHVRATMEAIEDGPPDERATPELRWIAADYECGG